MPFPDDEQFARVRVARLWIWPLIGATFLIVGHVFTRNGPPAFVPPAYATYAFLALAALYSVREAGISVGSVFGAPPDEVRIWGAVILMVPVMFTFAATSLWATAFVASWLFPDFAQYLLERQRDAGPFEELGDSAALLILFVVVIGPVIEEFVFRGVVLRRWMARRTMLRGVVGTSLLFAFLHPPFWIGAFVVGIFLSVLYLVTRSLYAPIAFHAMYNGMVTFVTLSAERAAAENPGKVETLADFRGAWISQTLLLLVSSWLVYRTIRTFWLAAKLSAAASGKPADQG